MMLRYRAEGLVGLVLRQRNRPGNRERNAPRAESVLRILRKRYLDCGPTLVADELTTRLKIVLAYATTQI